MEFCLIMGKCIDEGERMKGSLAKRPTSYLKHCFFIIFPLMMLSSPTLVGQATEGCPTGSTIPGQVSYPPNWDSRSCNPAAGEPPESALYWPSIDATGVGQQTWNGGGCNNGGAVMAYATSMAGCQEQGFTGSGGIRKLEESERWFGNWWAISNVILGPDCTHYDVRVWTSGDGQVVPVAQACTWWVTD